MSAYSVSMPKTRSRMSSGEPETCELVVRGLDLAERRAQPLLRPALEGRPAQVPLLARIVGEVVELAPHRRPERPVREQIPLTERLAQDRHLRAGHAVEPGA